MRDADQPDQTLTAALIQISGHAERIAALDSRYQQLADALSNVAVEVAAASPDGEGQANMLASLDVLERRVASLTTRLAARGAGGDDEDDGGAGGYRPVPRLGGGRSQDRSERTPSRGCVPGSITFIGRPTGSLPRCCRRAGSSICSA
ncbi:MAG: hypothetical protein ACRDRJ_23940 [Streptosporangiaceae bacterium]